MANAQPKPKTPFTGTWHIISISKGQEGGGENQQRAARHKRQTQVETRQEFGARMTERTSVHPGHYRHYKGKEYTVIGTARHSETLEELVVYRQEYGEHDLWVRPKQMFSESVTVDGQDVPRFQPLGSRSENVVESIKNIFDELPQSLPKEIVQTLLQATGVRIEQIVSQGHASPEGFWYDQPPHEWVVVLKGAARLRFADRIIDLKPGDYLGTGKGGRNRYFQMVRAIFFASPWV
ncbi:MAG: DUF1653 domain-containing protein [Pirellulales bacterium]